MSGKVPLPVVIACALVILLIPVLLGGALYRFSEFLVRPPRPTLSRGPFGEPLRRDGRPLAVLGVALDDVRSSSSGPKAGALVTEVLLGSARQAGLRAGDIIVAADGESIARASDLHRVVEGRRPGDLLELAIRRPESPLGGSSGGAGAPSTAPYEARDLQARLSSIPLDPADLGLVSRDVEFPGGGGLKARGWFIQAPARPEGPEGTVVMMHGNASNRRAELPLAGPLHAAGFALLLFDFTGRGDSDGNICTYGWREREDARQALRLAASLVPDRPIAFHGRSLGGTVALLAAADPRGARVDVVVADSPFDSLAEEISGQRAEMHLPAWPFEPLFWEVVRWRGGFDPRDIDVCREAPRVSVPVLLLHGTLDNVVPPEHSERIAKALGGPHETEMLAGAGHNDERPSEVVDHIVSFLLREMRRAGANCHSAVTRGSRQSFPPWGSIGGAS